MPLAAILPAVIGAAGTVGGALLSKKSSRTQTANQSGSSTSTTTPQLPSEYVPLRDALLGQAMGAINAPYGAPSAYVNSGIKGINQTADIGQQALNARLASAGLSTSPIAGYANLKQQMGRNAALNNFLTVTAPQYGTSLGQSLLATAPMSTTSSGTSTGTGATIYPGSAIGSGLGSAGELLALLKGMGVFGNGGTNAYGGYGNAPYGPYLP